MQLFAVFTMLWSPRRDICLSDNNDGNQPNLLLSCAWRFEIIFCTGWIEFRVLFGWLGLQQTWNYSWEWSEWSLNLTCPCCSMHLQWADCNILSQYRSLCCPDLPHCGFPRCCAHSAAKHCVQAVKMCIHCIHCIRIILPSESSFVLKGKSAEKCGWMMLASL